MQQPAAQPPRPLWLLACCCPQGTKLVWLIHTTTSSCPAVSQLPGQAASCSWQSPSTHLPGQHQPPAHKNRARQPLPTTAVTASTALRTHTTYKAPSTGAACASTPLTAPSCMHTTTAPGMLFCRCTTRPPSRRWVRSGMCLRTRVGLLGRVPPVPQATAQGGRDTMGRPALLAHTPTSQGRSEAAAAATSSRQGLRVRDSNQPLGQLLASPFRSCRSPRCPLHARRCPWTPRCCGWAPGAARRAAVRCAAAPS